jgi:hypothetical protein
MTLSQSIETDVQKVFLRTDDFAEQVTYYPRVGFGGTATSRSIKAVIIRNQIAASSADGGEVIVTTFEVHVENSSTNGIASSEIDTGGDQIGIASRIGGTVKRRAIVMVEDHDDGMITLQCQ